MRYIVSTITYAPPVLYFHRHAAVSGLCIIHAAVSGLCIHAAVSGLSIIHAAVSRFCIHAAVMSP